MSVVAVQIISPDSLELSLTGEEREDISQSISNSLTQIVWLPPHEKDRDPTVLGLEYTTAILAFILGVPITGAFAAYFKAFFGEAGKDSYTQLKKLLAKVWKKQSDKSYALSSTAYLIFQFRDEHVAFRFRIVHVLPGEMSPEDYEKEVEDCVSSILSSLDSIERDIKEFGIGDGQTDYKLHLIHRAGEEKWQIDGMRSWEFFHQFDSELPG